MKKITVAVALCSALLQQSVSADALKNVLANKLKQHDEIPGMVNLDILGTAQPQKPPSRPAKAVVATVNGMKILKKEADAYLSQRTNGQVDDFDLLPKKQRLALIKEMSLPILLKEGAEKALTPEEKEAVLAQAWMAKRAADANISEAQIEAAYEQIKAQAKAQSALQQIPPLSAVKDRIRMQIVERETLAKLMEGVQVQVAENTEGVAGYAGMLPISVEDVNNALHVMTKGKMTWDSLPAKDRLRVLQMVAPNKMAAIAAENDLTEEQKRNALSNYWMQKNISRIVVSDEEVKKRYEKMKKLQKRAKSKKRLPELSVLEGTLKRQIANEKFMESLTKQAKIKLK